MTARALLGYPMASAPYWAIMVRARTRPLGTHPGAAAYARRTIDRARRAYLPHAKQVVFFATVTLIVLKAAVFEYTNQSGYITISSALVAAAVDTLAWILVLVRAPVAPPLLPTSINAAAADGRAVVSTGAGYTYQSVAYYGSKSMTVPDARPPGTASDLDGFAGLNATYSPVGSYDEDDDAFASAEEDEPGAEAPEGRPRRRTRGGSLLAPADLSMARPVFEPRYEHLVERIKSEIPEAEEIMIRHFLMGKDYDYVRGAERGGHGGGRTRMRRRRLSVRPAAAVLRPAGRRVARHSQDAQVARRVWRGPPGLYQDAHSHSVRRGVREAHERGPGGRSRGAPHCTGSARCRQRLQLPAGHERRVGRPVHRRDA